MAKSGPKPGATETQIVALITANKSDREIARTLHVGREKVKKVRELTAGPGPVRAELVPNVDRIKAACLLELNQEETRNEFSDQLNEYTQNYKDALRDGDIDNATKWSALRLRLLEQMIKISGLDKRCEILQESETEMVNHLTDEEVRERARAVFAKLESAN